MMTRKTGTSPIIDTNPGALAHVDDNTDGDANSLLRTRSQAKNNHESVKHLSSSNIARVLEATVQKTTALKISLVLLVRSVLAPFKLCDWSTRITNIIFLALSLVSSFCLPRSVQYPAHMNESSSHKIHEDSNNSCKCESNPSVKSQPAAPSLSKG